MSNEPKRIQELDLAGPVSASDMIAIVQGSRTKRATMQQVKALTEDSCQCTLVSRYNTVGTDGNTLEKFFQTWQMPPNLLSVDGSWLEIYAFGACANNTNNKTIRLRFGSTVLNSQTVANPNNVGWFIKATVIRSSQNTQKALTVSEATLNTGGTDGTLPTEDLSLSVPISISGTNGSASLNDITCEGFIIRLNLLDPNS